MQPETWSLGTKPPSASPTCPGIGSANGLQQQTLVYSCQSSIHSYPATLTSSRHAAVLSACMMLTVRLGTRRLKQILPVLCLVAKSVKVYKPGQNINTAFFNAILHEQQLCSPIILQQELSCPAQAFCSSNADLSIVGLHSLSYSKQLFHEL